MENYLFSYHKDSQGSREDFAKAASVILKDKELLEFIDDNLKYIKNEIRKMSPKEKEKCIKLLVLYGSKRLKLYDYDDSEISDINKIVTQVWDKIINEEIDISLREIYEISISRWIKEENKLKQMITNKSKINNESKEIFKKLRSLLTGGMLMVCDIDNITHAGVAAFVSIIMAFHYLVGGIGNLD